MESTPPQESRKQIISVQWLIVAVCGLAIAGLYAYSFYLAVTCPYSLTYEGIVLWDAWQLAHGQNIYDAARLTAEPWVANTYPPLLPLLSAPLLLLTGPAFSPLRVITAVSAIANAYIFFLLMRKLGCSKMAACAGLIFFLGFVPVWFTSLLAKADLLSLLLQNMALLVFLKEYDQRERSPHVIPAILCVLSFLAKQQGIIAPATITLFLLSQKRYVSAGQFAVVCASMAAGTLLAIQLWTGGFIENITFLSKLRWSERNEILNLQSLGTDAIKIGLSCLGIIAYQLIPKRNRFSLQFSLILWFCSIAWMGYALGVPAATSNHMVPAIQGFALLLALACTQFTWSSGVVAIVGIVTVLDLGFFITTHVKLIDAGAKQAVAAMPNSGIILSEDPYWVLVTKTQPAVVDLATFLNKWKVTPEDAKPLNERIRAKSYSAIMINKRDSADGTGDMWTKEFLDSIKENYELKSSATGNGIGQDVFVPRK